ncbi:MAG: hypothetical protein Q7Q71_13250 [Verrucomicrobiota bacterium JB023]|nr:hypothetical protein [Verrucomicrobiota bacterium JB023]
MKRGGTGKGATIGAKEGKQPGGEDFPRPGQGGEDGSILVLGASLLGRHLYRNVMGDNH